MITDLPANAVRFLEQFFGGGNTLQWEKIRTGAIGDDAIQFLKPWFQHIARRDLPVVLPRRCNDNRTEWYAMAFTPFQFRMLKEDIAAFIGPTYTNFSGRKAELEPNDKVDAAVIDFCGSEVMKFSVLPNFGEEASRSIRINEAKVREALSLMLSIWKLRPERSESSIRPTGRILRDFEMAIACGNEEGALRCLTELRSQGRLSTQNMLFLKVRYLSSVSKWQDIIELERFNTLLAMRRPLLVTQEIIRAIYINFLTVFEENNDPQAAAKHFKEEVLPRYRSLFRVRGAMRSTEVLKSFMLLAAVNMRGSIQSGTRDSLISEFPINAPDRPYFERLASLIPSTEAITEKKPIELAIAAFNDANYDLAYAQLLRCETNNMVLRMRLVCADEIKTLDAIRETVEFIKTVPPEKRDEALQLQFYQEIWNRLDGGDQKSHEIPKDWIAWIEKLDQEGPWERAMQDADQGSNEWDAGAYKSNSNLVEHLSELLQVDRGKASKEELNNILPILIRFFLPNEGHPEREFRRLYNDFLYILALDSRLGEDDLSIAYELIESLFFLGLNESEYQDVVGLAEDIWLTVQSPRHLEWALDILDLLITSSCPGLQIRDSFLSRVVASLSVWARRVTTDQWDLAELLFQDLGQSNVVEGLKPPERDKFCSQLPGLKFPPQQLIGLYTLNESVGKRFKQVVAKRFPEVKIEICHDKVGSDRLRHLAQDADIFLLTWQCAKHAASDAIKKVRGGKPGLLYPKGKGCGSILKSLYSHMAEIFQTDTHQEGLP